MSRWTESQFVEQAQRVAQRHTTTKESINALSEKVARDNDLNPDEIRTLVRLANVATFQESFRLKTGGDKMVEFDTGDPEMVIRSMTANDAPTPATVSNDKLGSYEVPDQMRAKRYGQVSAEVKEASEAVVEAPIRRDYLILNLRKLAEEFTVEKVAASQRWEFTLDNLTQRLKRPQGYGVSYGTLEKNAWATFGTEVHPELAYLQESLRVVAAPPPVPEKIAQLQQHHVTEDSPELSALKLAVDARQEFSKLSAGLKWVDAQLAQLELGYGGGR